MLNALVIVWRESLEALLVIGVLQAWIARQPEPRGLSRGLWLGVAAGVLGAAGLAVLTSAAQGLLDDQAQEGLQIGMALAATVLIVQMLAWMRRHGRELAGSLQARAGASSGALGLAAVAALAVAREGAETVLFLAGVGSMSAGSQQLGLLLAASLGLLLAIATGWVFARSARYLNQRTVFRVSEALLLLVAAAMVEHAIDRLIAIDWLPPLADPAWDSSAWLPDGTGPGRLLADLFGYRARPSGMLLVGLACFWFFSLVVLGRSRRVRA